VRFFLAVAFVIDVVSELNALEGLPEKFLP
jgi:hypothetical protein